MTDPIISLLKFPFNLKDDQIEAVNAWMDNNYRGTILYSTGTGKTEISFECARRLAETYKKNDELMRTDVSKSSESIHHLTNQNDISRSFTFGEKISDIYIKHNSPSYSYSNLGDSNSSSNTNYSISFFNILFLVPRVSLINQTINRLIKYNIPKEKIGGYFGESKEISEIIVSTFHSVIRNPILIKRSSMVIIDEVHLIKDTSSSFKKIFDYLVEDPKKAILGLTATLNEKDFRNNSILAVLPPLKKYPIREAVVDKRLAKPVIIPISVSLTEKEVIEYDACNTKIRNISNKFKRYDAKSMTLLLKKGGFASGMAKAWFSNIRKRKLLLSYNENKLLAALDIIKNRFPNERIMVFSETLESIERLRDLLSQHKIDSRIIDAKVKSKTRSNILERWGIDFNVLLSIHTLELGVDVPQVRIEIILATTSDINQIVQRIGRVLRLIEGKTIGLIYIIYVDDTTDNSMNRDGNYRHLLSSILYVVVIFSILSVPFTGFEMVFAQEEVIDTITVGNGPFGVAYNAGNGYMYVTNFNSITVSVISSSTTPVQPPSATTITSSVDGNEIQVQNESSTVSTSITFEVSATQGTNPIAGFECSLDDSPFSNCATSEPATISYDNLAVGEEHTFKVRAIDTEGNTDANPATFIWTVLTPEQATEKLVDTIDDMELPQGTANSLQAPLNAAIQHLENNNEQAACGSLGAFLNQVDAKEGNGQLTPQQAAELRQQATALQNEIGCTSSTSTASSSTESNSPIESLIDSTLSNMDSIQSEQTGKALDKIQKDMGLYDDFFGTK